MQLASGHIGLMFQPPPPPPPTAHGQSTQISAVAASLIYIYARTPRATVIHDYCRRAPPPPPAIKSHTRVFSQICLKSRRPVHNFTCTLICHLIQNVDNQLYITHVYKYIWLPIHKILRAILMFFREFRIRQFNFESLVG